MKRVTILNVIACVGVQLLILPSLSAQQNLNSRIRGDTTGAPSGCSASAAIGAIDTWFAAFNRADSNALARVTPAVSSQNFGVFSTGRFTRGENFVRIESLASLVAYARARARHHEHLDLMAVQFYGWRKDRPALGFMPYFTRSADDLGPDSIAGIGKGEYVCRQGIQVLNLAPRPKDLPALP